MDYQEFKKQVSELIGNDLENYKNQQMDRRINSLKQLWDIPTYEEFLYLIKNDTAKYNEFVKKLTINVSEFFRNAERFVELHEKILPELLAHNNTIRIWSAGCSDGSEPYSVGIIVKEMGVENRVRIVASDVDKYILEKAKQATYAANQLKQLPGELISKYFTIKDDLYTVKSEITQLIEFRHHNLLLDPFEPDWDLIICRNVVIYFTEEAKGQLYANFYRVLKPGGYLLVGGTEPILTYRKIGFESGTNLFYRKPDGPGGVRPY